MHKHIWGFFWPMQQLLSWKTKLGFRYSGIWLVAVMIVKRIISDSLAELNKANKQMKLMETVLLGAAKQAQAKADEIAKFMNENEQLRSLHEEQRVYALVGERDALRREQNKKNDGPAFRKGKR